MASQINRRDFVKGSLAASLAITAGAGATQAGAQAAAAAAAPKGTLPMGKIGNLEIGRMLLGGNLLTHACHSRDLLYVRQLTAHYNTDEKIGETLEIAENQGINTLVIHTVERALNVLRNHRKQGGKMQWIICTTAPVKPGMSEHTESMRQLVDDGFDAIYLWGVHADRLIAAGTPELIGEAVERMKLLGVPVGVGAHNLEVVEWCEKNKVENDFYIKTFHHHEYPSGPRPEELKELDAKTGKEVAYSEHPGFWCRNPEGTIAVMRDVKKPWIAFKVMAAGAIPPANAFKYAFQNGADFILAGMFDYEIAQDAELIRKLVGNELPKRERPWMA